MASVVVSLMVATFFIAITITQIIIPIMKNEKMFPMFRKQRTEIEDEIVELNEKISITQLMQEKAALEARYNELMKK